jgi:hypothetical protein
MTHPAHARVRLGRKKKVRGTVHTPSTSPIVVYLSLQLLGGGREGGGRGHQAGAARSSTVWGTIVWSSVQCIFLVLHLL